MFYCSISQKGITSSGRRFITVGLSGVFITLSGGFFITLSGTYYSSGRLLHYRLKGPTSLYLLPLQERSSPRGLRGIWVCLSPVINLIPIHGCVLFFPLNCFTSSNCCFLSGVHAQPLTVFLFFQQFSFRASAALV